MFCNQAGDPNASTGPSQRAWQGLQLLAKLFCLSRDSNAGLSGAKEACRIAKELLRTKRVRDIWTSGRIPAPQPKSLARGFSFLTSSFVCSDGDGSQICCNHKPEHTNLVNKFLSVAETLPRTVPVYHFTVNHKFHICIDCTSTLKIQIAYDAAGHYNGRV